MYLISIFILKHILNPSKIVIKFKEPLNYIFFLIFFVKLKKMADPFVHHGRDVMIVNLAVRTTWHVDDSSNTFRSLKVLAKR